MKQLDIPYRQEGEYLIPDIIEPEQPKGEVGRYGRMREEYLKKNNRRLYLELHFKMEMKQHLLDIDHQMKEMIEDLTKKLLKVNPGPSKEDILAWTAHQEQIANQAEEIALKEIVYR